MNFKNRSNRTTKVSSALATGTIEQNETFPAFIEEEPHVSLHPCFALGNFFSPLHPTLPAKFPTGGVN